MATQYVAVWVSRPDREESLRKRGPAAPRRAWGALASFMPHNWGTHSTDAGVLVHMPYRSRVELGRALQRLAGLLDKNGDGWVVTVSSARNKTDLNGVSVFEGSALELMGMVEFWTGVESDPHYDDLDVSQPLRDRIMLNWHLWWGTPMAGDSGI